MPAQSLFWLFVFFGSIFLALWLCFLIGTRYFQELILRWIRMLRQIWEFECNLHWICTNMPFCVCLLRVQSLLVAGNNFTGSIDLDVSLRAYANHFGVKKVKMRQFHWHLIVVCWKDIGFIEQFFLRNLECVTACSLSGFFIFLFCFLIFWFFLIFGFAGILCQWQRISWQLQFFHVRYCVCK